MEGDRRHDGGGHGPRARFDDLVARTAFELLDPLRVIRADRFDEVKGAIAAAERAAREGHWVAGYVAYEAAAALDADAKVRGPDPADGLPLVWFAVFGGRREAEPVTKSVSWPGLPLVAKLAPSDHATAVTEVRARIAAGDVYEVNLTDRLEGGADLDRLDPFEVYAALCDGQRGAHHGYLDTGRHVIASASPELFFAWRGDVVTARPMKGTRRRGRWSEEDDELAGQLLASQKDRAENVMIVDLVRNDLGRVAQTGSVAVMALCELERYPTVWQLTSTITARLRPEARLVDLLATLFPSGSVTGAPKLAAMETIAALETTPRGVYCGAVGWLAPSPHPDRARFNVAIRTAVIDRTTERLTYGAGGAITWDSDPREERSELLTKARIVTGPAPTDVELLETMRFDPWRGIPLLSYHLARLRASAHYFGLPVPVDLVTQLRQVTAPLREPSTIRMVLRYDGCCGFDVSAAPPWGGRVTAALDLEPVDPDDVLLFHKTTQRDVYDRRRARHPDSDDVVMVSPTGHVTETSVANLVVEVDGRWCTPPLRDGCLPGVARRAALDRGQIIERPMTVAELRAAPHAFAINALRGWRRLQFVDSTDRAVMPH